MPRKPDPQKEYLELHGTQWRVSVAVPAEARRVVGTGRLRHPLGTDSLRTANLLKKPHVERFKRRIAEAVASMRGPSKTELRVAIDLGKIAAKLRREGSAEEWQAFSEVVYEQQAEIRYKDAKWITLEDPEDGPFEAEEARPEQARKADTFSDVAYGRATPIDILHADYLAQLDVTPRTKADDERALKFLLQWCAEQKVPATLERIDKKQAYAFADSLKATSGHKPVTLNKYLGRLSSYWQFLINRTDAVVQNVFEGVTVRKPKKRAAEKERPFTNREVADLLLGPATPHMHDLMMIGALTGARLNAIVELKVSDVRHKCLFFNPQKKESAGRFVPIHPDLAPVIERRIAGKAHGDDLFPEWPPVKKAGSMRERSFKTSNHFTEYRRTVGVADVVGSSRRSRVNFHSFRRWFISRMQQAGVAPDLISGIVGHANGSITLDVYSEGPEMRAARRAMPKLRLPPLDGSPVTEPMQIRAQE
ncbi:tyrosine-type recombinase/integrase [Methylobacterium soli]|uniref:tyrosine-type recombinase/integrase n=1 Tax=Methylobacterium soli TaxID=553447 RepID=UPI001EE27334|nr:tyrosine-type recombinase/integrase [Methylobacterium soli]